MRGICLLKDRNTQPIKNQVTTNVLRYIIISIRVPGITQKTHAIV